MKKRIFSLLIIFLIIVFLIWIIFIIKNEVLTSAHGDKFKDTWHTEIGIGWVDKYKVVDYSENYAEVYYLQIDKENGFWSGGTTGHTIRFNKTDNKWEFVKWDSWYWDDKLFWPYVYDSPIGVVWTVLYGVLLLFSVICTIQISKKPVKLR